MDGTRSDGGDVGGNSSGSDGGHGGGVGSSGGGRGCRCGMKGGSDGVFILSGLGMTDHGVQGHLGRRDSGALCQVRLVVHLRGGGEQGRVIVLKVCLRILLELSIF